MENAQDEKLFSPKHKSKASSKRCGLGRRFIVAIISLCRNARGWKAVGATNLDEDDDESDDCFGVEDKKGREALNELANRLEGVINLVVDKKQQVNEEIKALNSKQYKLKDELLKTGTIANGRSIDASEPVTQFIVNPNEEVMKIDLMTLIKKRKMLQQFYKLLNNVENNMYAIRVNTEKHQICHSSNITLNLVPHRVKPKKVEDALTLATRYNDIVNNMTNRIELPLDSKSLQDFPCTDKELETEMESFLSNNSFCVDHGYDVERYSCEEYEVVDTSIGETHDDMGKSLLPECAGI